MSFLNLITLLFTITALGGYINFKYIKLPSSIGMLLFSTLISLGILGGNYLGFVKLEKFASVIKSIDFDDLLLHGFLCVLLFAGALHLKIDELKNYRYSIFNLSTIGVLLSTFITGGIVYYVAHYLKINIPFLYCLLFGALISPTDAVAVMSLLKNGTDDKALKARVNGESLFNDGTAIVLFLTILGLITQNQKINISHIALDLVWHMLGGIILGLLSAWLVSRVLKTIDMYQIEIMMTLALAFGSYALAELIDVSAPISTAVAGLFIGNKSRYYHMSDKTREHVDMFWELLDEILNAILFILIGLELVLIAFNMTTIILGVITAIGVLIGRYISILGAGLPIVHKGFDLKTTPILMTWAGLRGGISIALALSLPNSPYKETLLTITYICVIISIMLQGTTLPKVLSIYNKKLEE
jgi:CPA1 family monovalent cation:H+ antiporter